MNFLHRHYATLVQHRYKLLLISLLVLVLGSGLAPANVDPRLFATLLLQNMVVGALVFWEERPLLLIGCLLAVLIMSFVRRARANKAR